MYLIVGLGNPEEEYSRTRHNMGFDVINKLAEQYEIKVDNNKFQGIYGKGKIENEDVILLKPQTYMNLSGESVAKFANFYKINPDNIIVIYDDFDISTGIIKIRKKGGPGTHNGMKSVVSELGTQNFPRIRVGTGTDMPIFNIIAYVIKKVDDDEYEKLEKGIDLARQAVPIILKQGIEIAMSKLN